MIDTAKTVYDDCIIDPESVRKFITALRDMACALNFAIVLITHTNRKGETSGTTEWENHARAVVHLKKHNDHFLLEVVKNNYAAPIAPRAIVRAASGLWSLRSAEPMLRNCAQTSRHAKDRREHTREIFLENLDGFDMSLSTKKNSPKGNYAPMFIASRSKKATQLGITVRDLETAMVDLLAAGAIAEIAGSGKHKTKFLTRMAVS